MGMSRRALVVSGTRGAEILREARALVLRDGLDGLTLRKLARELGIRAPSLYRYFRSKEDLLGALQQESLRAGAQWMDANARAWEEHQGRSRKRQALAGLLGTVAGAISMPPEHAELLAYSNTPRALLGEGQLAAVGQALDDLLSGPRARLRRARDLGALAPGDAVGRTIELWLVVQGASTCARFAHFLPGWPPGDEVAHEAARSLLLGWGASKRVLLAVQRPPLEAVSAGGAGSPRGTVRPPT